MYDAQFPILARHYRVVRYDLHGYGRSGKPAQPYTHHEVLHGLLRHLGIERAALLGMSIGGMIAINTTLYYPESVAALLLLAAGVGGYPMSEATQAQFAPLDEAFDAGDFVRAIDFQVHIWVDGPKRTPDQVDPAIRERLRGLITADLRRSREPGVEATEPDPPAYTRLDEIQVPTLVVVGDGDIQQVQDQADYIAQHITGARRIILPHVAHVLNMEIPDQVNQIILDFLREVYPSS
jgi:pimeloyl-ACP methyl ester carboxylesterase